MTTAPSHDCTGSGCPHPLHWVPTAPSRGARRTRTRDFRVGDAGRSPAPGSGEEGADDDLIAGFADHVSRRDLGEQDGVPGRLSAHAVGYSLRDLARPVHRSGIGQRALPGEEPGVLGGLGWRGTVVNIISWAVIATAAAATVTAGFPLLARVLGFVLDLILEVL